MHRRVYAEYWRSVLVGPGHSCLVPGLIPQEGILGAIQAVDHQVHRASGQIFEARYLLTLGLAEERQLVGDGFQHLHEVGKEEDDLDIMVS